MTHFELLCVLRGINGDGPDCAGNLTFNPAERVVAARLDPEWAADDRALIEQVWSTFNREATLGWVRTLVDMANYLSELVGGDVAVLAPRDVVEASAGLLRAGDEQALLIGRVVQRSIAVHVERNIQIANEAVLDEIRRLLGNHRPTPVPVGSRWLSTKDLAARLSLDEITVARLCRKGLITAEKTAGGQWRATEDMLRRSPYLNGQTRRKRGNGNGKLE